MSQLVPRAPTRRSSFSGHYAVWRPWQPENLDVMRMMYLAYWLMILGGIVLWMVVGLTVQ